MITFPRAVRCIYAILLSVSLTSRALPPFPGSTNHDYWAIEDPKEREKLPLYKIIPAAKPDELTPANGYPKPETFLTWHRSHGDNGGMRYSALDQINRINVTKLQQAWIYHSRDGSNYLQCNPIVVRGIMLAPTAGKFMVGINAENGKELWRFKPEGRPAFRGLVYWEPKTGPPLLGERDGLPSEVLLTKEGVRGTAISINQNLDRQGTLASNNPRPNVAAEVKSDQIPRGGRDAKALPPNSLSPSDGERARVRGSSDVAPERILFCAGKFLYALNPTNGQPISSFGENGHTLLPGRVQGDFGAATAGPATFQNIIVVPGFEKDVWGFDVLTGKLLWTFHTVPHPGEFGYETWDHTEDYGANCWMGMAMDDVRGIAYISTGGPKPNFIGITHLGDNLFANCLIALDARTGKRLWHFQEIPHDLWDRDISAPPNLATITHDGKRVDVVAVTTKNGDTLLLDRVSGKPIFPFRMRRAPTSDLPGEVTAPYQPDPELPERFAKMEFTAADLTDRTEEAESFAQLRFKSCTTGFFRPPSLGHPNLYWGMDGGAEWSGACVDPTTGRLYVSANHLGWMISVFRDDDPPPNLNGPKTRGRVLFETNCASCHGMDLMGIGVAPPLRGLRFRLSDADIARQVRTGTNGMTSFPDMSEPDLKAITDYLLLRDRGTPSATTVKSERPRYSFTGYPRFLDNEGYPASKPPWGTLNCLDLNTGKLIWTVPLGEYPALTAQGTPITGTENYGGAIITAGGLLFCSGTRDAKIRAFDKDTGKELWFGKLPWVGSAPPTTYSVNGRQFVVIASCGNKLGKSDEYGDAYVAFALPKSTENN